MHSINFHLILIISCWEKGGKFLNNQFIKLLTFNKKIFLQSLIFLQTFNNFFEQFWIISSFFFLFLIIEIFFLSNADLKIKVLKLNYCMWRKLSRKITVVNFYLFLKYNFTHNSKNNCCVTVICNKYKKMFKFLL